MDIVEQIADFVLGVSYESLPPHVKAFATNRLVDTFGVMIAGFGSEGMSELTDEVVAWGGVAESRIVGCDALVPAHHAALVNGAMARALDYDDVHERALSHPSVGIVPALFAVAGAAPPVSGRELLAAFVAGVELSVRLGLAPTVGSQVSGMSHTYQPGLFGAAAAIAKVQAATRAQLIGTLGHAYGMASGNQQCVIEASMSVRLQQGYTAMSSVLAARLGRRFPSVHEVFEGTYGYFPVYHPGGYDREAILSGLGVEFEFLGTSLKPYPNGRATHAAIEAGRQLRSMTPGTSVDEIDYIEAEVSSISARLTAPRGQVGKFGTPRDRMFSQAWSFALGFVRSGANLDDFVPYPPEVEEVEQIARLVRVVAADTSGESLARQVGGVRATLHTKTGRLETIEVPDAYGSPERPLRDDQIDDKFLGCCRWSGMKEPTIAALLQDLRHIDRVENAATLLGHVRELRSGWAPS